MNNINIIKFLYVIIFIIVTAKNIQAQSDESQAREATFKTAITLGINASQLDGDNLGGYNKLGISGGIRTSMTFAERHWALVLELLATQKGSKARATAIGGDQIFRIHLNFVEIPVLLQYSFDKIALEGGGYYARLLSAHTEGSSLTNADFKKNDAGILLGVGYSFSENWSATLRHSRSLTDIVNHNNLNTNSLYGHLFNIQIAYQF